MRTGLSGKKIAGMLALVTILCTPLLAEDESLPDLDTNDADALDAESEPAAYTNSESTLQGQLTVGVRLGSSLQEYHADGMLSFWTTEEWAYFFDLRGSLLEDTEQEINAGIVVRRLLSDQSLILGGNLYYDTRWTQSDSTFDQVGVGGELLSKWVDARANYYYPLGDPDVLSESVASDTATSGNTRVTRTTQTRVYEEALQGFDFEIGAWIP